MKEFQELYCFWISSKTLFLLLAFTTQTYFPFIHWCSAVKTLLHFPTSMKRCLLFMSNPHPTAGLRPSPCSRHVKRVSCSSRFHSSFRIKQGRTRLPLFPQKTATHGPLEPRPIRSSLTPLQTSTMFTPMSVAEKPNEGEVSGYRGGGWHCDNRGGRAEDSFIF